MEGKSSDRNLSFLFFHISSRNGLGAANIWMPNSNFPTSGSQPSLPLLCQVLMDSRPKPGRPQTPFPRAMPCQSQGVPTTARSRQSKKGKKGLSPFFSISPANETKAPQPWPILQFAPATGNIPRV